MTRRDIFTLAVSLVVSLAAGEAAVRLALPRPGFTAFPAADAGVMVADAVRGFAYAPNLRRHIVTPDYEYDFATNAMGLRDAPLDSGPPPRTRILAVGDSFTQGLGVEADAAWPQRLASRVDGARVYNAGVSGYSLHNMRLTALQLHGALRPDLIVVGLYGFGYRRVTDPFVIAPGAASPIQRSVLPHVRIVPGGMLEQAFETPALRDLTFWADGHWYLAGHLLHAVARLATKAPPPATSESLDSLPLTMQPFLDELLLLQRNADSLGIPLAGLLVNRQSSDGQFGPVELRYNEVIMTFAAAHHICVVNPLPALMSVAAGKPILRFRGEYHWTNLAHDIAADALVTTLRAAAPGRGPCARAGGVVRQT